MMRPDAGPHLVSTAAVVVENTHNFGGGTVQPLEAVRALRAVTGAAGVADAVRHAGGLVTAALPIVHGVAAVLPAW